jgi:hypothetical protein
MMNEDTNLFNPETTDHEVFSIKDGFAYIGFKLLNGNFHFVTVPYTEPNPGKYLTIENSNHRMDSIGKWDKRLPEDDGKKIINAGQRLGEGCHEKDCYWSGYLFENEYYITLNDEYNCVWLAYKETFERYIN